MLLNTFLSVSLLTLAATGPSPNQPDVTQLSKAEKAAAVQRVVNHATECVVNEVRTGTYPSDDLGERIVAAMPTCAETMRTMIESFDANYGEGSGETFFSGSFLDILPQIISKRLTEK
jgi:hypothetical protein